MARIYFIPALVFLVALVSVTEGKGDCFQFTGNGRVNFEYEDDHNDGSMHFRLKFKTKGDNGVLYYAEGRYHRERAYDYEGLFLKDGYLHYFLFNPNDYGIGSTSGFYGKSLEMLNDSSWHTVNFFRNVPGEVKKPDGTIEKVIQTGFRVDGVDQTVANQILEGIRISKPITLGEDPHHDERASSSIGGFKGKIKDFQNVRSGKMFESDDVVGTARCIAGSPGAV